MRRSPLSYCFGITICVLAGATWACLAGSPAIPAPSPAPWPDLAANAEPAAASVGAGQEEESPESAGSDEPYDEFGDEKPVQAPRNAVFSTRRLPAGAKTGTGTAFSAADHLYARFVLPRALQDLVKPDGEKKVSVSFTIVPAAPPASGDGDNNPVGLTAAIPAGPELWQNPYWDMELIPDPADATGEDLSFCFAILDLPPGKYRVRVRLLDNEDPPQAVGRGEFELDTTRLDGDKLKKDVALARANIQNKDATTRGLPSTFQENGRLADPAISGASLNQLILKDLDFVGQILKIAVSETRVDDWEVISEGIVPKYQDSKRMYLAYRGKDGKFYYVSFYVRKDALGGGGWGKPYVKIGGNPVPFSGKM